jgi:MFS family permease
LGRFIRIGSETVASFKYPGYFWFWFSMTAVGYAAIVGQIAIYWMALELTGSAFGVGIAVASRSLPRIIFGVPFGALSDRYDRCTILIITFFAGTVVAAGAVFADLTGNLSFGVLVCVAVLVGILDVAENSVSRAMVYDLVGSKQALNGMSHLVLANKISGGLGALSVFAGVFLAEMGTVGKFGVMGIAFLFGAIFLLIVKRSYKKKPPIEDSDSPEEHQTVQFTKSLVILWKNKGLLPLAIITAIMEILAYSSEVLLPTFARDVFGVGESWHAFMTAMLYFGGVAGVLVLAGFSTRVPQGRLLVPMCAIFGLGLIAFAASPTFIVALFFLFIIGVMWATLDSLLPTLVQYTVSDKERGASVGVWNLSRGLGPLGQLEIGAVAGIAGASLALIINGSIIVAVITAVVLYYRSKGLPWSSEAIKSEVSAPDDDGNKSLP